MNLHIVIGLGITGLSCLRFLRRRGIPIAVMDTRENPPNLAKFRQEYPDIPVYMGKDWPQELLNQAQALVVSPGVGIAYWPIQEAKAQGVEVIGDIELFARFNQTPVVAITGSNGKSTVTTLVGEMARAAGKKTAVVGNIGTPVLDILDADDQYDLIVMELSSFQLETTTSLHPLVATVLNISPDHLDRYPSIEAYIQAKHRIYQDANQLVINKDDPYSDSAQIAKRQWFTLSEPLVNEWGLRSQNGQSWLCYEDQFLLAVSELKIFGQHNVMNALSALALGAAAGLDQSAMLQTLRIFSGLPHRCQWVAAKDQISWINDSKGTNIGACQAALKGIGSQVSGKIVLLLGGDGKGADFTDLLPYVSEYCRAIILMGKDATLIANALGKTITAYFAQSMSQAIAIAANCAKGGDVVLLSPACSSLDQYRDFTHRGEIFMESVRQALNTHV